MEQKDLMTKEPTTVEPSSPTTNERKSSTRSHNRRSPRATATPTTAPEQTATQDNAAPSTESTTASADKKAVKPARAPHRRGRNQKNTLAAEAEQPTTPGDDATQPTTDISLSTLAVNTPVATETAPVTQTFTQPQAATTAPTAEESRQRRFRFDNRQRNTPATTSTQSDSKPLGPLSTIWRRPPTATPANDASIENVAPVADQPPSAESETAAPTRFAEPEELQLFVTPTVTPEVEPVSEPVREMFVEPEDEEDDLPVVDIVDMSGTPYTPADSYYDNRLSPIADDGLGAIPLDEDTDPAAIAVPVDDARNGNGRHNRRNRRNGRNRNGAPSLVETMQQHAGPPSIATPAPTRQPAAYPEARTSSPATPPYRVTPEPAPLPPSAATSPEPMPARGFGSTQRGVASEYRAPVVHTTRGARADAAPYSTNHIASIVSEAIQQQTDRLLSEQRRGGVATPMFTVAMPSTERIGIFVDVANLVYSSRNMHIALDFGRLLEYLRGDRRLIRAHAYCPTSPDPAADQQFLSVVKGLGYRITTKDYKTFSSGAKKADLDLDLCMDIVRMVDARAVDTIVLVSGDSDFLPLLAYCSDHGVRVEVAAFDESTAAILRQVCDLFINLSHVRDIRM